MKETKPLYYPKRLLPKDDYHVIKELSKFSHMGLFYLARQQNASTFKKEKSVVENYFPATEFLRGLSTNLLSVCKKKDNNWKLKKGVDDKFKASWLPHKIVEYPMEQDVDWNLDRPYVSVKIKDVFSLYQLGTGIRDNVGNPLNIEKLTFKIKHAPTCCNFWHFEIFVIVNFMNGKQLTLKEEGEKLPNNNSHTLVKMFIKQAQFENIIRTDKRETEYRLPKYMYKSNSKKYKSN